MGWRPRLACVFFVVATWCVAVGTRSRGMTGRYVSDFMCHLLEEQGHSGEDDDVCLGRSSSSRSSLPASAAASRTYTPVSSASAAAAPSAAATRPRRWMGGLSSFVALEERARRSGGGAATANTLASARTHAGTRHAGTRARSATTLTPSRSSPNGYIDYEVGALPIIITAPYGGGWTPATIADRTNGCYNAASKTCTYSHSCGAPSSSCKVYSGRVGYVILGSERCRG